MSATAIVGGGLAGGAAAVLLARAGTPVVLLERQAGPVHKMCGEFVSGPAAAMLDRLGVDLHHLGAAPITQLRLVTRRGAIVAPLPFLAFGLTRRRLDAVLLDRATAAGTRIERGVTVRAIGEGTLETGLGRVDAPTLLLASGKQDVRGLPRDAKGANTGYVGFKTYWRVPPAVRAALAGSVEIVLFDGGYAGLQCVEEGLVNLCLLVRKARLAALDGAWDRLLATLLEEPHLSGRLGEGEQMLPRPITIAGVPYGFVHDDRGAPMPSLFRLGDQAAVIPSFCGDGMAIALHSAHVAAATLAAGGTARDHHARLRRDVTAPIRLAVTLQNLGERDWSRRLLWAALRIAPGLATHLARATRVR